LSYFSKECKTAEELKERAEYNLKLTSKIKGMNFTDAISFLLKEFNLSVIEITNVPGDKECLSYRAFDRYKNCEMKKLSKRIVISMCIAMGLPLFLSKIIIEIAGFTFTNTFEDNLLLVILEFCVEDTFEEINKKLRRNDLQPLTKSV
jgi:hypothetical protein